MEGQRQRGIRVVLGRGWPETAVCITDLNPFLVWNTVHKLEQVDLILTIKLTRNFSPRAENATGVFTPYPNVRIAQGEPAGRLTIECPPGDRRSVHW
jgi:hypothetical protein